MNQLWINKEQITSIRIQPSKVSERYKWREQQALPQRWFDRIRNRPFEYEPAGFYELNASIDIWNSCVVDILISREDILKDTSYMIQGTEVLLKVQLILKTADDKKQVLYFSSTDEAKNFINIHFNDRKYLELTQFM